MDRGPFPTDSHLRLVFNGQLEEGGSFTDPLSLKVLPGVMTATDSSGAAVATTAY